MPLYEYTCGACGRRFTWLVGVLAGSQEPSCDRCGSTDARRLVVTRIARIRTEDQAMEALSDPENFGDMDDPRAMRKWAKDMGSELGEDLGDEFDAYADEAESGAMGDSDDL